MTEIPKYFLELSGGFASREAAASVAQLDDQSKRLLESIRDITPEELEWQAVPGRNTIGMLLAHLAIVEVVWAQIGYLRAEVVDTAPILGLGQDDDGIPLPPDARPPAHLSGKPLAYYTDLLSTARRYYTKAAAAISDSDLERQILRTRRDGTQRMFNTRWVLYHALEHYCGHYGQILLLRHLHREHLATARHG